MKDIDEPVPEPTDLDRTSTAFMDKHEAEPLEKVADKSQYVVL